MYRPWILVALLATSDALSSPRTPRRMPRRSPRPQRREPRPTGVAPFDGKELTANQVANEDAEPLDLSTGCLRWHDSETPVPEATTPVAGPHFEFVSLDSLFPNIGFSDLFSESSDFRQAIRTAMRTDVFYSTPAFASLSPKATAFMLHDDSSVQGSWQCSGGRWEDRRESNEGGSRMTELTTVLSQYLGSTAPTGDELMDAVGALCGTKPSTHWIDIRGVQDRQISHSWHQDTGYSPDVTKTVLWGFPATDNYDGTGVFTHIVPLVHESPAPEGHPRGQPILWEGTVDERHIVRPRFARGRELIVYRDIDVIHSAPDVAYRASVMRFM